MRKTEPVRYSSAVGEAWMHCMFKTKYAHKIFDDELYREAARTLILESAYEYEIEITEIGFDNNHVHFLADIGMYSRDEVAKFLKGPTAKRFFEYFPELKKPKHLGGKYWGSGLWNPSYYIGAPKSLEGTIRYIRNQKYGAGRSREQTSLESYAS